jgi:hypothetical protein
MFIAITFSHFSYLGPGSDEVKKKVISFLLDQNQIKVE